MNINKTQSFLKSTAIYTNTSTIFLPLFFSFKNRLREIYPNIQLKVFAWDNRSEHILKYEAGIDQVIKTGFNAISTIPLSDEWRRSVGRKINCFLHMAKETNISLAIWLDINVYIVSDFISDIFDSLGEYDCLISRESWPQPPECLTNYNTGQLVLQPSKKLSKGISQLASHFYESPETYRLAEQTVVNRFINRTSIKHTYMPDWAVTTNSMETLLSYPKAKTIHQVGVSPGICIDLFQKRGWMRI